MMEILIKLLQWPCNEPLNALRATPTRKRNCLLTSFPLPHQKKKLITWPGSDEGRIALHSLDRDLRLALSNFLLYKKLNEYQEVAHWEVDIATYGLVFRKSVAQAWTGTGVQARCQDMTIIKRGNKKRMEKLIENVKLICLQTPIWKVSCHRSIISGLLGSFNGKWLGFSMVCPESELRLVELFTFPG